MSSRVTIWIALLWVAAAGTLALAQASQTDAELLSAFDSARFLERPTVGITVRVTSATASSSNEAILRLLFKTIDGQERTRIEFLAPADLAGQVYLITPDVTYFWQPDLAAPLAISSRQSLFGDSAVAQTSGIRFADDYGVASREAIVLEDGKNVLRVTLSALRSSVAFPQAVVTADAVTLEPLSFTLFALSGAALYDVRIEEYADVEGDLYAKTQVITNLLIEGNVTRSEILVIESGEIPDALFDPAKLGA